MMQKYKKVSCVCVLLRSYKYSTTLAQVKDDNNVTGTDRKSCPFYDELDAVLGTRAASSPPVLIESGVGVAQDRSNTPGGASNNCTQGALHNIHNSDK